MNLKLCSQYLSNKIVILMLSLVFLVCSGGCLTYSMWATNKYKNRDYFEQVSQMLISKDKKYLVVLGKQHHYVMRYNKQLNRVLSSSLSPYLRAEFGTMTAFTDTGNISGIINLTLVDREYSQSQLAELKKIGFIDPTIRPNNQSNNTAEKGVKQNNSDQENLRQQNPKYLRKQVYISGKYYQAGNFKLPNNDMYQLNQIYTVKVLERTPKDKTATNLMLTPVTLVADGVLTVVGIPLIALLSITN